MRRLLLLPFAVLGLAGCIHETTVERQPPASTTVVTPSQPSTTTVVRP